MTALNQVVQQMFDANMPPLPVGHPKLDGKYHRYGHQKKNWYILREIELRSSKKVVTGAFGFFQGENRNTIPVTIDAEDMSDADRAEYVRKQREYEQKENEERERDQSLAANRAKDQWSKSVDANFGALHPYLVRKQVEAYGLRVFNNSQLVIPMWSEGGTGARLMGLQKIDADGTKLYNKGVNKIGAAYPIGLVNPSPAMIAVGEGYATCAVVHQVSGVPVVVAFDAGNISHVARALRAAYPQAHLLLLADDDYLLIPRFIERLREDFNVSCGDSIAIDSNEHSVIAGDGQTVTVSAWWRTDAQGIDYIESDMRKDRMHRRYTYKNAGVSSCYAAANAVGNATVIKPVFTKRHAEEWTDFNDLLVQESPDALASQIRTAIAALQPLHDSPAPSIDVLHDSTFAIHEPSQVDQNNFGQEALDALDALEANDTHDVQEVPSWIDDAPEIDTLLPPPPLEGAAEMLGLVPLKWALSHCALIQGTTDVWDAVNQLRIKKAAFVSMVGKEAAKEWEAHAERRSISPRNLPQIIRGVAKDSGGTGDDGMSRMLDRYTLLYGTKTVWDADKKVVINFDAMALARGELATRWLQHPLRLEKDHDKLVFDPKQKVDPETHINMFEGFQIKPKQDDSKAALVLRLLESLCSSEPNGAEVFVWVLKWLAYPLQHPGAKMQTGLLFFGEKQGTGKSLFFEGIVKPIYGKHGATGGQNQLDSTYSAWRSQKLYVLFEEILSRQDKYSSFGLVKHLITGRDTPITQKFKDDRFEDNHLNVVMLSNEFQAVPIEPDDRRFQVVEARALLDLILLAEIVAELENGLIEAFYDFLLRYPLDGFNPHTKPIMTPSKQRMIEFGRPDWEVFYLEWQMQGLSVPYCSCVSEHLYVVYERYCSRYHFRALSLKKFSELISSRLKRDRQWIQFGVKKKRLLTVFHVPSEDGLSLSEQCSAFRTAADIKDDD